MKWHAVLSCLAFVGGLAMEICGYPKQPEGISSSVEEQAVSGGSFRGAQDPTMPEPTDYERFLTGNL